MAGQLSTDRARWRWATASQIGTSHVRLGTRKQDALRCFLTGEDSSPVLCAIVCDGAGSAEYGGQGASLVCRILSVSIREHFRSAREIPTEDQVWAWIDLARDSLAVAAERKATRRQAFATTLVMLVATPEKILTVHVGDGAIVAREKSGVWRALSWPESGEYASTTYFVTEDPAPKVRILSVPVEFDAIAIFTDGIENLALDHKAMTPHEPFFRNMMSPIDNAPSSGKVRSLSDALASFLKSEKVCSRTDDDKSLILASVR